MFSNSLAIVVSLMGLALTTMAEDRSEGKIISPFQELENSRQPSSTSTQRELLEKIDSELIRLRESHPHAFKLFQKNSAGDRAKHQLPFQKLSTAKSFPVSDLKPLMTMLEKARENSEISLQMKIAIERLLENCRRKLLIPAKNRTTVEVAEEVTQFLKIEVPSLASAAYLCT